MVGVVVDNNVIVVPIPVVNISDIKRSHAEVVSAEPEAARTAAPKPPNKPRPEAALEVAVFPRMIQVESGVVRARIVSDPFPVLVDMRGIGMSLLISKGRLTFGRAWGILNRPAEIIVISGRPGTRNIATSDRMTRSFRVISAASAVAFMLREEG